jgi:hypothetical protein
VRVLLCMLLALGVLAGCGGDDDDAASAGGDATQLVDETFSNMEKITSGRIDLSAEVQGAATVEAALSGPFQSQDGKLPQLDLDATLEGGGQRFEAGLTVTADQGFVSYQGTDYEVSDEVFEQLQTAYRQASQQQGGASLATLGIDPRNWLTDARTEGDSEVGGTETIKITGGVDVQKLLEDLNARSSGRARSGSRAGATSPSRCPSSSSARSWSR